MTTLRWAGPSLVAGKGGILTGPRRSEGPKKSTVSAVSSIVEGNRPTRVGGGNRR